VAAADKFRGTATAPEVCAAIARGVARAGGACRSLPMADGGEGTLDALGGPNRTTLVAGPLGDPVQARWRLRDRTAVVEMAQASGLALVGGAAGNDPLAASTHGTGEVIAAALDQGARRILVGVGGSATTDGGLGALRALAPHARLKGVELVVAVDVTTPFVAAAAVFAPQKGATPAQVALLTRRLERLAQVYRDDFGVDVTALAGAGAGGGIAGGLAAIGGRIVSGFEVVADEVDLAGAVEEADLVVTGEGHLDAQSFDGKVVGGVAALAAELGVPVLAVAGEVDADVADRLWTVSLVERYGVEAALARAASCIEDAVAAELSAWSGPAA
jgi:glycerate kinase